MRNTLTIFRREFSSYFNSPIAYIFIVAILAVCSGLYSFFFFFAAGVAEMRDFFSINSWLMLFFIPAITMRLWSEEQKSGSIALLQSLPMKSMDLVLGKFFAGLGFYVLYLIGTLPILIAIIALGHPDVGPIFGGYLGLLLMGGLYTAVGLFFSGLFKDQITAWVMAVIGAMVLHLLGWLPIAAQLDSWIGGLGTFLQRSVGSLSHFDSMYKGVITINDIIYFLSFTAVFLVLNALTVEQRMRRQADLTFTGAAVVMFAVAAMLNMVVYQLPLGRWDATEGKIYTISNSAKNIIENLKTDVTLRYYVTPEDKMPPGMKDIQRDITDKLEEFKKVSNKIKFEVVDPTGNDELEKSLSEKGVTPFTLRTTERDAIGIKKVYSSIAISYLDKPEQVIPQVMPSSFPHLEYDICSMIFRMTQAAPPVIALVAPYEPMDPRYNDPRMRQFMRQMGQEIPEKNDRYKNLAATYTQLGYNLNRVDLSSKEPLPDKVKALIVLEPKDLSERQKYEIAKELYAGKDVIIAAQEYKYNYNPGGQGNVMVIPTKADPGINNLISNYGVTLGDKMLMDEQNQVVGIQAQKSLGFLTLPVNLDVQSPVQIRISPEDMNQDYAFTANLGPMVYLWGSPLKIDSTRIDQLGLKLSTLMTSSPGTWESDFSGVPLAGDAVNPDNNQMIGRQPLAIILEGQFPDPYLNQPPPKWQDLPDSVAAPTQPENVTAAPGKLMLIGDSEIFSDQFIPDASYTGQRPAHEELLLKAIEGFALSEDLLHIRSKMIQTRYLKETSPLAKVMWRIFIILLAPAIIIAFGVFRMIVRRDKRAAYKKLLEQAAGGA